MRIDEITSIEEGPNDPHIFKAVFLAGGPGSGKSFVAGKMLRGTGLKTVNSDEIYEYLMTKKGMDMSDPEVIASKDGQETRNKAKDLTNKRQGDLDSGRGGYLQGRLGLVIDGTGKDVQKVAATSEKLKASLGIECHCDMNSCLPAIFPQSVKWREISHSDSSSRILNRFDPSRMDDAGTRK